MEDAPDMPQDQNERAREAYLRELIRVVVESSFASFMVIGIGGVQVRQNLVTFEPRGR